MLERHGAVKYDNINELTYLMQVCQGKPLDFDSVIQCASVEYDIKMFRFAPETLRLYPAFSFLTRQCTPTEGRNSYSLKPYCDLEVPRGFPVYVPIYALHRDSRYFPDPYRFDPDRFDAENVHNIPKGTYLPFGTGPRSCVAERLGYLVMKLGLYYTLLSHTVEICEETPTNVRPHHLAMLIVPNTKIYLRIVKDQAD